MSMRTALFLTLAILPAASGCVKKESVDSQDVTTHGMSLEMDVVNDGTKSKVYAALHVGDYQSLVWAKLTTGDQLIVTDPTGSKQALTVIYEGNKTAYGADLAPGEGDYLLDFNRQKGASALGNKLTVPKAFTLAVSKPQVSRTEMLSFSWGASNNGTMAYALSGPCIQSHVAKSIVGDPGSFTINAGEIKALAGKEMETCQLTLKVTRTIETNTCCSAEFGHTSHVRGIQERTITFDSKP